MEGERSGAEASGENVDEHSETSQSEPKSNKTYQQLTSPSLHGMASGIDWGVFRDDDDDAFTWLMRSNTMDAASTPSINGSAADSDLLSVNELDTENELLNLDEPTIKQEQPSVESAGASSSAHSAQKSMKQTKSSKASKRKRGKGAVQDDEERKKQVRREKNLRSVRAFRQRKMQKVEQNEARLKQLEAENMDLKMRLKIGKEAIRSEQEEKQQIKDQMSDMLRSNASDQDVARFLNLYKTRYSDYGPKRREKLSFHLERIRELLLPTQVTKLSLYSVEQGQEMIARDNLVSDDPEAMPGAATASLSLWSVLAKELDVTESQQKQILERRASIKKAREDLDHALGIVKRLEEVTHEKNTGLESQVAELQRILTPTQATKFIIWVKENPAFMYMLDKLVDSTLMTSTTNES